MRKDKLDTFGNSVPAGSQFRNLEGNGNMNMTRIFIMVITMALIAGCGRNAANSSGGVRVGAFANGTANPEVYNICDVRSLESDRDRYTVETERLRMSATGDARASSQGTYGSSGAQSGDASAAATGNQASSAAADGTTETGIERTRRDRVVSRINSFDAEIDAKYRSVIASCRAFSRCMQNNYYDEGQCRSTLTRWENADRNLSDLARDLREIEAQVQNLRTVSRAGKRGRGYRVNRCDKGGRNCSAGNYDY